MTFLLLTQRRKEVAWLWIVKTVSFFLVWSYSQDLKHGTVAVTVLCTVYECLEDLDLRCAGLHLWAPRWRAVGRKPEPARMLVCYGICKDRIWLKNLAFIGVAWQWQLESKAHSSLSQGPNVHPRTDLVCDMKPIRTSGVITLLFI